MKKIIVLFAALFFCLNTSAMVMPPKPSIAYTDMGQGTPLVLIHAFPTDQDLWTPQRDELKKYFRVITVDLWGFGQSEHTDGSAVSMHDYAAEVKQLLDQLHIQKAIVGGESMGGYVTLAFLQQYPDTVSGLILSDTQSIADSDAAKAKREATAVDILNHGTTSFIDSFMPKALSPEATETTRAYLHNILDKQSATGMASALRGMALREDTSAVLASTTVPILIITGDADTLISPQQSEYMHTLAKNSQLVTIAHAGHLSSLEQVADWNKAVINRFYQNK